ncbi:MAG: carboxymuconolactone decarboxylase family protein [Polyangiaceae bacterium]
MQQESLASIPGGQRRTSDAPHPQTPGLVRMEHTNAPRLAPLARGGGVLTWLMKRFFRWKFGREMAPLSLLFPRFPGMVSGHLRLIHAAQTAPDLDPLLVHLVELRTSLLNGCTFCADLHRALAHDQHPDAQGVARRKLAAIERLEDEVFSDQERAALRYTEEVTRHRAASDAVFDELTRHFSDRQIVQLTVVNAVINYTNLMALPLGLQNQGFCALVEERHAGR